MQDYSTHCPAAQSMVGCIQIDGALTLAPPDKTAVSRLLDPQAAGPVL
jgi:hypothetical protein